MYPGLRPEAPGTTAADFGYVTEEYFVSGTANGRPTRRASSCAARCPPSASAASWSPSRCTPTASPSPSSRRASRSSCAATCTSRSPRSSANVNTTLKGIQPGALCLAQHPVGAQTSEIIAQVGVLIKSNLSNGPLAPLSARRLFLEGTSQASAVLRTYQQQKHVQARMADGSLIMRRLPRDEHARQRADDDRRRADRAHADDDRGEQRRAERRGVPARGQRRPGQPLSPVRGGRHGARQLARDADLRAQPCTLPVSDFPWGGMAAMGLNHLIEWADQRRRAAARRAARVRQQHRQRRLAPRARRERQREGRRAQHLRRRARSRVRRAKRRRDAGGAKFNCSIAGWRVAYDALARTTCTRTTAATSARSTAA